MAYEEPAFPSEQGETQDGCWNQSYTPGMSLRDYFAAKAMEGSLSRYSYAPGIVARMAYEVADAMMYARIKPKVSKKETKEEDEVFHD